jgi:hypothetical protein
MMPEARYCVLRPWRHRVRSPPAIFSPPSPLAVTVSRWILDLPPGLEVTNSAGNFAKESLYF